MEHEKVRELLEFLNPSSMDYTEWTQVGMALKHEGLTAYDWEQWSARDSARYHPGECYKKWESFSESTGKPVTAGTLYKLAQDYGWEAPPKNDYDGALDWNDTVCGDDHRIIDTRWVEGRELNDPGDRWNPIADLTKYIETLFQMDEYVGTVTKSYETDGGRRVPTAGDYTQTAGQILAGLRKTQDIGAVIGDYSEEAGAWIRFNPLDGEGCKNDNVSDFRYALVESDTMDIEKQNAIIRELELPVACLVHSGKKSIHAIVRIDAANYDEYRKRVDFLYEVCKKNGLVVDTQNRNPSRLSRMPGVIRNGQKQYLIDVDIGKKDWAEWKEFIEAANDDLPDPENLDDVWDSMPDLAPPLIDGVLRQGHKMLIAGPSKAGKSFALIELCCALAEGRSWLGWKCAQGRVLYVNLEVDRPSCMHRFREVYTALGWRPDNLKNIDIWNLRGASVPMDKLAPRLIRRASKKNYTAVIIDPIYKVITGDENSADQMAHFCNQFDKVCTELGCAVIYCHHHSKGSQGDKRSMDRASGSGVFARDPDALLDMIELEQTPTIIRQRKDIGTCAVLLDYLQETKPDWEDEWHPSEAQKHDAVYLRDLVFGTVPVEACEDIRERMEAQWEKDAAITPWRIEGTLREFPKFEPKNVWFNYPIHIKDESGLLEKMEAEGNKAPWQKAIEARKDPETKKQNREAEFTSLFDSLCEDGQEIFIKDIVDNSEWSRATVSRIVKAHPDFYLEETKNAKGGKGPSMIRRKKTAQSGQKKDNPFFDNY